MIVEVPDTPRTFAVLSVPVEDPSPDADVRPRAGDADDARWAAIEHARQVADAELERAGLGTTIELRYGDDEWRAGMGLPRQGGTEEVLTPQGTTSAAAT